MPRSLPPRLYYYGYFEHAFAAAIAGASSPNVFQNAAGRYMNISSAASSTEVPPGQHFTNQSRITRKVIMTHYQSEEFFYCTLYSRYRELHYIGAAERQTSGASISYTRDIAAHSFTPGTPPPLSDDIT